VDKKKCCFIRKKMSAGDDDATESNNDENDNNNNNKKKIILQTHFLLFLSQVNWMGMHIVFAVALRSSTKALVLPRTFSVRVTDGVLLFLVVSRSFERRKRRRGGRGGWSRRRIG